MTHRSLPSSRFIHIFPCSLALAYSRSRCCSREFPAHNFQVIFFCMQTNDDCTPTHPHKPGVNVYKSMIWRNEWIKSEYRTGTEQSLLLPKVFEGKSLLLNSRVCRIDSMATRTQPKRYIRFRCLCARTFANRPPPPPRCGRDVCNVNKLCVKCVDFKCLLEANVNRRSTEPAA